MGNLIGEAKNLRELEAKVKEHFSKMGWQLERFEFPGEGNVHPESKTVLAVPRGIEDELEDGDIPKDWYNRLQEIGRGYEIRLGLPCWIYMK